MSYLAQAVLAVVISYAQPVEPVAAFQAPAVAAFRAGPTELQGGGMIWIPADADPREPGVLHFEISAQQVNHTNAFGFQFPAMQYDVRQGYWIVPRPGWQNR